MELEEVKRFSLAALQYAVDGRYEIAATIVNAVALNGTGHSLYAACCTWAGSAEVALERVHGPIGDNVWSFTADPGDGPAETFARRFITAYGNDDPDTTVALFRAAAAAGDEQFSASLSALLSIAARANEEAAV